MLKTLGEATGGYIGFLDMILRESAIRALKKGLQKVDLERLKKVAAIDIIYVWDNVSFMPCF